MNSLKKNKTKKTPKQNTVLTSRPAGCHFSCAKLERGTGHRSTLTNTILCSILRTLRIATDSHQIRKLQFEDSPLSRCSYLRVNYNYGRFNLALNRKQLFGLRYGNRMSKSFGAAEGTNLFSGAQTNFLLIRTTH